MPPNVILIEVYKQLPCRGAAPLKNALLRGFERRLPDEARQYCRGVSTRRAGKGKDTSLRRAWASAPDQRKAPLRLLRDGVREAGTSDSQHHPSGGRSGCANADSGRSAMRGSVTCPCLSASAVAGEGERRGRSRFDKTGWADYLSLYTMIFTARRKIWLIHRENK